ncbi:hypothetical protein K402DRAFT_396839 [Aulographum hederae CBS 113979]|uniref:Large ribosomal subunit protein uL15/eL18 domain-containing protein n=1 Tax=Aulographum hederae CBS 113979 TaxID=1176131 RepID=A0A6G1GQN1_9PEZI|nr:hypothetical protein K402DRAFT_396839 [Aulographum hederae CBS 113979]
MPPRILRPLALLNRPVLQSSSTSATLLVGLSLRSAKACVPPTVQCSQTRNASILGALSDNKSAYGHRIRRGRGPASGKGKTSGRGHKGQKQHGKVPVRAHGAPFNGGQTPNIVYHGVRGEHNPFAHDISTVNIDKLQQWIDQGRIDPSKPITVKELVKSRCIHGVKDGVKLLARGSEQMRTPVQIIVSRASATAIAAIEASGGQILTRYYTKPAIRRIMLGLTSPGDELFTNPAATPSDALQRGYQYRLPGPTGRKDIEYYRDAAHRGFLSHTVAEGDGPSLFFKVPKPRGVKRKLLPGKSASAQRGENRLW